MSFKSLFKAIKDGGGIDRYREQTYQEAVDEGENPADAEQIADDAAEHRRAAGGAAAAGGLAGTIG
jgi:hypothetical protein